VKKKIFLIKLSTVMEKKEVYVCLEGLNQQSGPKVKVRGVAIPLIEFMVGFFIVFVFLCLGQVRRFGQYADFLRAVPDPYPGFLCGSPRQDFLLQA
jgi:hypothetical protein